MIYSFLSNKREVYRLDELLKQSGNLAQDLQEELEMKDSLTIKELILKDYESQDTYNGEALQTSFLEGYSDESTTYVDDKEFSNHKAKEESLLQIEAELEAELEMLEQNMKSSSFERKLTNLVELDPEFVPDIVQGELRIGGQLHADRDGSGGSTAYSVNYSVSPSELSLQLHQVLQTRLEERIKELEAELQNKLDVDCIGSESTKSCKYFSNSESGSSTREEQRIEEDQPKNIKSQQIRTPLSRNSKLIKA